MNYEVIRGQRGDKQIRFWPHPKVMPVNLTQINLIAKKEFPGVRKKDLWIIAGFVNVVLLHKTDGTEDTEKEN